MIFDIPAGEHFKPEQRRAYLADMLATNETYPCQLRTPAFGVVTFETREAFVDFISQIDGL